MRSLRIYAYIVIVAVLVAVAGYVGIQEWIAEPTPGLIEREPAPDVIHSRIQKGSPKSPRMSLPETQITLPQGEVLSEKIDDKQVPLPKSREAQLPSATGGTICEKYDGYTRESWRQAYLHETFFRSWHVFVASLDSHQSEADAKARAVQFRSQFPNHDFNVMSTISPSSTNPRYAIVIAEGLSSESLAKEIARYASRCGIAGDAYAYRQGG